MVERRVDSKVERFTDLEVWRRSHHLFLAVINDLENMPHSRVADVLLSQIVRSLGSVGANIAEGFNRSKAKFLSALDIALGEANESENWLYKLRDGHFLERTAANGHVKECVEIEKMLNGLIGSISKRPDRKQ